MEGEHKGNHSIKREFIDRKTTVRDGSGEQLPEMMDTGTFCPPEPMNR